MIPKDFDQLIQAYLTDGVISEKERQVLLKKAEKMGLDVDEVDLYIDAQQQKSDQLVDAAVKMKRGATCPFCGSPVPQLTDKCPHCGQFITPEASRELEEILNALEDALVDFKSSKDPERSKATVERYARKAKLYYSNNPRIKPLLSEIGAEMKVAKSNQRKDTFVNLLSKSILVWSIALVIGGIALLILDDGWYDPLLLVPGVICLAIGGGGLIKKIFF